MEIHGDFSSYSSFIIFDDLLTLRDFCIFLRKIYTQWINTIKMNFNN